MKSLPDSIEAIAHFLPKQGSLDVFVHLNQLQAFEEHPFEDAVEKAARLYGSEPYLKECEYRRSYLEGRITDTDLRFVIAKTRSLDAEHDFRVIDSIRALLVAAPDVDSRESVLWELLEGGCLERPLFAIGGPRWDGAMARERAWLASLSPVQRTQACREITFRHPYWNDEDELVLETLHQLLASESPRVARISLRLLWLVALKSSWDWGIAPHRDRQPPYAAPAHVLAVRELLLPFTTKLVASFLDQGLAAWHLPYREHGFLVAALSHLGTRVVGRHHLLKGIHHVVERTTTRDPYVLLEKLLHDSNLAREHWYDCLLDCALHLKGWAGFMHLIEHRQDITTLPPSARQHALADFLAVKLLIEQHGAHVLGSGASASQSEFEVHTIDQIYGRAFHLFRWCQVTGTTALKLANVTDENREFIRSLFLDISGVERRRLWHLAYERHLERRTYKALLTRASSPLPLRSVTRFQVVTCLDDREESFRRHLEALGGHIETYGTAGFFGVDVEFENLRHETAPFCPVAVTPRHRVTERAKEKAKEMLRRKELLARSLHSSREVVNLASRGALGGWMWSLGGFMAFVPMVLRTLFPRVTHLVSTRALNLEPGDATEILYQRAPEEDQVAPDKYLGYTISEMADRVEGLLKAIGIVERFSPLVVLLGHGSSSRNNPFRSAYDCGACGGRPGRINGRVFALMANRTDVRKELAHRGLIIPDATYFLGGYHDTCSDEVMYFEASQLPSSHAQLFNEVMFAIDTARKRNAVERCRRFGIFPKHRKLSAALAHVQGRADHIAEPRHEYGHATNAICFIGRRTLTRGLFFDRRAFLVSYDPRIDPHGSILRSLLDAAVPVCMGINLDYFFSSVDNDKYGAGSKLPLNISALIGVITGFASDLRIGMPAQAVDIHEPVRLTTVVECSVDTLREVLSTVPYVNTLVANNWIRMCAYNSEEMTLTALNGLDAGVSFALADLTPEEILDEVTALPESMDNLPFVAIHHSR